MASSTNILEVSSGSMGIPLRQVEVKDSSGERLLTTAEILIKTRVLLEEKCGMRHTMELDPTVFNLNDLDRESWMLKRNGAEAYVQKLPSDIELTSASVYFLRLLVLISREKDFSTNVFRKIQKPINLEGLRIHDVEFIKILSKGLAPTELVNILPDTFDYQMRGGGYISTVVSDLAAFGLANQLAERVPKELPPFSELGSGFLRILDLLVELLPGFYEDKIEKILPERVDLSSIDQSRNQFWQTICISHLSRSKIVELLPEECNLSEITVEAARFIAFLVQLGLESEVVARLPKKKFEVDSLSEGAFELFKCLGAIEIEIESTNPLRQLLFHTKQLLTGHQLDVNNSPSRTQRQLLPKGHGLKIVIPKKIRMHSLSNSAATFLLSFLSVDELARRSNPETNIDGISSGGYRLLSRFADPSLKSKEARRVAHDYINVLSSSLRQPIDASSFSEVNKKVGPYLFECIQGMPITPGSMRRLKDGWIVAELYKTGSKSYVYIHIETESFKVVFRTSQYTSRSIHAYQEAVRLLPMYITTATYPELYPTSTNIVGVKIQHRRSSLGFREIFSGISVREFDAYDVPHAIKQDIENQIQYILLKLRLNNVEHGHPHRANFNVRFLLTSQDESEKIVSFDINAAIQTAVNRGMSLTPIVTLRDWDLSTADGSTT